MIPRRRAELPHHLEVLLGSAPDEALSRASRISATETRPITSAHDLGDGRPAVAVRTPTWGGHEIRASSGSTCAMGMSASSSPSDGSRTDPPCAGNEVSQSRRGAVVRARTETLPRLRESSRSAAPRPRVALPGVRRRGLRHAPFQALRQDICSSTVGTAPAIFAVATMARSERTPYSRE